MRAVLVVVLLVNAATATLVVESHAYKRALELGSSGACGGWARALGNCRCLWRGRPVDMGGPGGPPFSIVPISARRPFPCHWPAARMRTCVSACCVMWMKVQRHGQVERLLCW